MKTDKLPWFKCFPERLLNALGDLRKPEEKLVYLILILRIYDAGGPIKENLAALASRAALPVAKVKAALAELIEQEKIITADGLLSNAVAEKIIQSRNASRLDNKAAANKRWEKEKQNQQKADANALRNHANLDSEREGEEESKKEKTDSSRSAQKRRPRAADDYTEEFELKVWQPYPRKRGTSKKNAFKRWSGLTADEQATVIRVMPTWKMMMRHRDEEKIRHLEFYLSAKVFETIEIATIVAKDQSTITDPKDFTAERWASILAVYRHTNDWKQAWGPPPGRPGTFVPENLSKQALDARPVS